MREGRSGIGPATSPARHDANVAVAAEIRELPDHGIEHRRLVTMDRFSLLAVIAARDAMAGSGLRIDDTNGRRAGAIIGAGVAGWSTIEDNYRALLLEGARRANIFSVPRVMTGAPAAQVSMDMGLRGPVCGVTSACSTGNHAIAAAADQIILGRADIMLAGGTETPIVWGILKGWEVMRILARDTCRPFSADREGLVLGEGPASSSSNGWSTRWRAVRPSWPNMPAPA